MQNKATFTTIVILGTILFLATLTISLTIQPTFAVCSPKNPKVCAGIISPTVGTGTDAHSSKGNAGAFAVGTSASSSFPSPLNSAGTGFFTPFSCQGHAGVENQKHNDEENKAVCSTDTG